MIFGKRKAKIRYIGGKNRLIFKGENMKYIIEKIQLFNKNLKEDHIEEYATQCAYYTILAFIPFLMLIITLIKYIGLEENILFFAISQMVPENFLNATVMDIVKEVYSKSIGTVTISALFT